MGKNWEKNEKREKGKKWDCPQIAQKEKKGQTSLSI